MLYIAEDLRAAGLYTIYFGCTDQSDPLSGAPIFYLHSNLPLNVVKEIQYVFDNNNKHGKFRYFDKEVQICFAAGDGLCFSGNVFHNIAGNQTEDDRVNMFFVVQIRPANCNDDDEQYDKILCDVVEHEDPDWKIYNLRKYPWLSEMREYRMWDLENGEPLPAINWGQHFRYII